MKERLILHGLQGRLARVNKAKEALYLLISGRVQGVGFRPFIHRVALKSGITGFVKNLGGSAVEVWAEGAPSGLSIFLRLLKEEKPNVVRISKIKKGKVRPRNYARFIVEKSDAEKLVPSEIPPDFCICRECLEEILDPHSKWYGYPFNSCAFCGPRFSIIQSVPYDRENTSMRDFPLCEDCGKEYNDVENIRRYHAEGISCPSCGPKVALFDRDFRRVEVDDPIGEASSLITAGFIVAVKGIGGYHIAASATDDAVVERLRRKKNRPEKPFAVMVLNLEVAKKIAFITKVIADLLTSIETPIVLARMRPGAAVSPLIAPGLKHIGIFLPYTGLHHLLLSRIKEQLAIMTSGNPPGEPMCTDEASAYEKLREFVDFFLVHNRRIVNRVDDSVLRITRGRPMLLRRGRGYAPEWIRVPFKFERPVIAYSALLQNSGAITIDDKVILTQYIGDVDDLRTLEELDRYMRFLIESYRVDLKHAIVAVDLHPSYPSTIMGKRFAEERSLDLVAVPHHWAHVAALMAEYGITDEVVGIAIDGAGYGIDGKIWGGEVLRADFRKFERVAHLQSFAMPGGDMATIYPVRMLISILSHFMDEVELKHFLMKHGAIKKGLPYGVEEFNITINQLKASPVETSSLGRALDAVSALLGVAFKRTYEGEPAIKLEEQAVRSGRGFVSNFDLELSVGSIIKTSKLFEQLVSLLENGCRKEHLAYIAQYALGYNLGKMALKAKPKRCDRLAISGGASVNEYVLEGISDAVRGHMRLLLHRKVSAGDGGIALGQAVVAHFKA